MMNTQPASTRNCDGCALCCKLLEIRALSKPANQWCTHCSTKRACDAYDTRPDACRNFFCGYITNPSIPEAWAPAKSRMMVVFAEGNHIFVHVDPARADAWRAKPYYNDLKSWARQFNPQGIQVIINIAGRYHTVLPDRDVDLGHVADDETITFTRNQTPNGVTTEVRKVKIAH